MSEERHECKTYAEMLETKAGVHVDLVAKGFTAEFWKAKGKDRIA